MRRILLSSLLSACVFGIPRNSYPLPEYDYNNNSSDVGDEVDLDYSEYEDESSDIHNCSLAAPLYYPLRRSESIYKGIRGDIIQGAISEANSIEERIQRRTERDRGEFAEFYRSVFRYPVETEFNYKEAIATASLDYLTYTDIFHSYISLGDFPVEELRGWRYRYSSQTIIARAEKELDELVSNLSEDRNRNRNIMKNVVRLIKPDTWPYLASCLYEAFKENQDSSSLSQAVTDLVSEDDFEKFNGYFKYYVRSIAKSLRNVLESRDTIEMVQLIYELTKSEIKFLDYNSLQPTLYYFVLQLKTVLMKPDIKELWTRLNQTQYFVKESRWMYRTGRWPEMATFMDNFLRRNVGSIVFWDRLTGQFLIEMKNKIPEMKEKIPDKINDVVEKFVDNFDELFELFMDMIADGDEASLRQLFEDIRGSEWDKIVISYIEVFAGNVRSCNLATLASYLPSYDDIKSTMTTNDFFQPIKTLLFKDWPQDEIYPTSIEDFIRRMYDTRFPIFRALFGSPCV